MNFGLHVSAAGGAFNAPTNAAEKNCEVLQFFTRSPQGGPAPKLTPEIVAQFKANMKTAKQATCYVHAPYYINFASANPKVSKGSVTVLREELERCSLLGVSALMTHLGSAKDTDEQTAYQMTSDGIAAIIDGYTGSCQFLLEIAAGTGQILGDSFEQLALFIKNAETKAKKLHQPIGICLDTCHLFAAGYDLRTKKDVDAMLKKCDDVVGLDRLRLIHANDSQFDFGSRKDRHAHLGEGKIGVEGFKALVQHPKLKKIDFILETHHDGGEIKDLELLKSWRKK